MLIHLGPARATDEMDDLAVSAIIGLLYGQQFRIDECRHLIGGVERRAGRKRDIDLNAPFVKRRQEVTSKTGDRPAGNRHAQPRRHEQNARSPHAEPDQRRRQRLQHPQEHPVLLVVRRLRLRQQVVRQDWRHRQ